MPLERTDNGTTEFSIEGRFRKKIEMKLYLIPSHCVQQYVYAMWHRAKPIVSTSSNCRVRKEEEVLNAYQER